MVNIQIIKQIRRKKLRPKVYRNQFIGTLSYKFENIKTKTNGKLIFYNEWLIFYNEWLIFYINLDMI